jgi:hypothetical protein
MSGKVHARMSRMIETACKPFQAPEQATPVWRESADICALADIDRHLGHVVRVGKCWIAYDSVHVSASNNGFRVIGTFASIAAAKKAVEDSVKLAWIWPITGIEA